MWKNFFYFFGLFAYMIGTIGGFGVATYNKETFIAICVLVLAAMGFPVAKRWFKSLTN